MNVQILPVAMVAACLCGTAAVVADIPDHWGARSVHVWHPGPAAEWIYGEVKVEASDQAVISR